LTVASRLLGDEALLDVASRAGDLITPDMLAADQTLDVLGGSAGTVLALLRLAEATGERRWVARAALAGERLLAAACPAASGGCAWRTMDRLRSGLSHGAAGIACALARLGAATGDERCLEAARRGVRFEAGLFDGRACNWNTVPPEERGPEDEMSSAWCYGAAGIGLTRLDMLSHPDIGLEKDELRQEVDAAVTGTLAADWRERDHICCGNFGRLELLWEGGRRLNRSAWQQEAMTKVDQLIQRASQEGHYQFLEEAPPEVWFSTLFLGEAGIGYQLLRLAAPDTLPSILMWNIVP
jgi:lantibiotic modifying enzyme